MISDINYISIIYFVKTFVMNICIYYSFIKIINIKNIKKSRTITFLLFNLLLSVIQLYENYKLDSAISKVIIYALFGVALANITSNKYGHSLIATVIAYAICNIALFGSIIINFVPQKTIYNENLFIGTLSVIAIQFLLLYAFFKIRKFKNGFSFINKKMNNDTVDIIVYFISVIIVLIVALISTLNDVVQHMTYDFVVILVFLGITMFIMIQRTLTMQYKQKQLLKTMKEYEEEIKEKNIEIERLSNEKYNTSKIRHEFYHRQKALELLVKSKIGDGNIDVKETNQNILDIINTLTSEYSEECEKVKNLNKLPTTGIVEVDSMFKYMQKECANKGIEFRLKIAGNIHYLTNNIIPKSRLETLIGDHIKDAINAIDGENTNNKEILVILGINNDCYELAIFDTGKEFDIDVLLKLGTENATTCRKKGGSGIGFMTTFETLEATRASLIITEKLPDKDMHYTKSVTIRFDGKKRYIIRSYRAEEIANRNDGDRILIENLEKE